MLRDMTRATTAAIAASAEGSPADGHTEAAATSPPGAKQARRTSAAHLLVALAALALTQWPTSRGAHAGAPPAESIDPEALHALRITARRLRTLLDVFSPWIKPRWRRELTEELHWLGESTGLTRDADVFATSTLPALRIDHPAIDWPAIDAHVAKLRGDANRKAAEALTSDRQRALHSCLRDAFGIQNDGSADPRAAKALRRPSRTPGKRPRALAKHAHNVLRARYIALFPQARQLAMLDTEQLHALRVKLKQARYSTEALAPWMRKAVRAPYQDTLRVAQELLGQVNDAVVAQRLLEAMALSAAHRDTLTGRLDSLIVNTTSRAAHVLCHLPDAHTLERGMRPGRR
ncbi:CHAD domain-containing protein [Pandoraea pnomenusa]|jgi:CHAD domain-containing protein|nr:hypothetical protein DA70_04970 [Pandoraea pnomenusa]